MTRESFGQRLRRFRQAAGLSQRKLALKAGLSNGAISQAESDSLWVGQDPSVDVVRRLARALDITIDDLSPDPESEAEVEPPKPKWTKAELLRRIGAYPIVDRAIVLDQMVSAGKGSKANIPQGLEVVRDIDAVPLPNGHQQYVVRVTGDCMVPDIMPGWTVRFDPDQEAQDGDLVVAAQDGEKALVKWLDKRATLQYLLPLNGEPIMIDENIEIVGVVTEVMQPPPRRPKRPVTKETPEGQLGLPED